MSEGLRYTPEQLANEKTRQITSADLLKEGADLVQAPDEVAPHIQVTQEQKDQARIEMNEALVQSLTRKLEERDQRIRELEAALLALRDGTTDSVAQEPNRIRVVSKRPENQPAETLNGIWVKTPEPGSAATNESNLIRVAIPKSDSPTG